MTTSVYPTTTTGATLNTHPEWSHLPLSQAHVNELISSAITPRIAQFAAIYTATTVEQLPSTHRGGTITQDMLPALVYPTRQGLDTDSLVLHQVKPLKPRVDSTGRAIKYVSPAKSQGVLGFSFRYYPNDCREVLVVEGTKQSLAVLSHLPEDQRKTTAVAFIPGIWNWRDSQTKEPHPLMSLLADKSVTVIPDADASRNGHVLQGATALADAIQDLGARDVRFVRVPDVAGAPQAGIDDYLGSLEPAERSAALRGLIEHSRDVLVSADEIQAANRTILRDSFAKLVGDTRLIGIRAPHRQLLPLTFEQNRSLSDEIRVYLRSGELVVLNEAKSDTVQLVRADRASFAAALSRNTYFLDSEILEPTIYTALAKHMRKLPTRRLLRDNELSLPSEVLFSNDTFDRLLAEARIRPRKGESAPLPALLGIAITPFVNKNGEIITKTGYYETEKTYLDLPASLENLPVPTHPTTQQVDAARNKLLELFAADSDTEYDGWLFREKADQTHAVAALITNIVRPMLPTSPLFLFNGLQPGVGKDALLNTILAIARGKFSQPGTLPQNEEEFRKNIIAQLDNGATAIAYNEAQGSGADDASSLNSAALRSALTATELSDRKLGKTEMLEPENKAIFYALGNNVDVSNDMARRVVPIFLEPVGYDAPENRSNFRIPNPAKYALENRAELLTAALTLVRHWYAVGQPAPTDVDFTMASFEQWQHVVGGILETAGFEHFLGNVLAVRRESNFAEDLDTSFLYWLDENYPNGTSFLARDVAQLLNDAGGLAPAPFSISKINPPYTSTQVGHALKRLRNRNYGGMKLCPAPVSHRSGVNKWCIEHEAPNGNGGNGGNGGTPPTPPAPTTPPQPSTNVDPELSTEPATPVLDFTEKLVINTPEASTVSPVASHEVIATFETQPVFDQQQPPLGSIRHHKSSADLPRKIGVMSGLPFPVAIAATSPHLAPPNVLYLDLETATADELYTYGSGFIRLAAYAWNHGAIETTTDLDHLRTIVENADFIVGHNILSFDLPAIQLECGIDLDKIVNDNRVFDTLLAARHYDPPTSPKKGEPAPKYSLDALCSQRGIEGKLSHNGDTVLKNLANEYGGYDHIPVDHPDYVAYAIQDVEMTRQLAQTLYVDNYLRREHRAVHRLNHISKNGFRVDTEAVAAACEKAEHDRTQAITDFHTVLGLQPGSCRRSDNSEATNPHSTAQGIQALEDFFDRHNVHAPRTEKGRLQTNKDAIVELRRKYDDNAQVKPLIDVLARLNGIRTVAGNIAEHMHGDRIHPSVTPDQSTGRVGITKPALTTMGKRDRKNILERSFLLPDEGHVLVAADLGQIDARAIAALAQDDNYLAALEPGQDLHDFVAEQVFGSESWDKSTQKHHPRRSDAKAITHGMNYGSGAQLLARQTGATLEEAKDQLARFEQAFPQVTKLKKKARSTAQRDQILYTPFGRRTRVRPGQEHTQAPAMLGQATARDLMLEGLLRLPEHLLKYLRAMIHDELVFSVPAEHAEQAQREILNALQFSFRVSQRCHPVPVIAELSDVGRDWADIYRSEKPEWSEVSRDFREQNPDWDTA